MELWIRSQDKEKLVKVNDIAIEMNMIYGYFDKNTEYEHLGSYATKERALKVLDEIQYKIQCMNDDFYYKEGYETDTKVYDGYKKQHKDTVYQMPKD